MWLATKLPGTLVLIDRDFLDPIVNRIVHIWQQLNEYTGNHSSFETQRAQKLIYNKRYFQKRQKQMSHI